MATRYDNLSLALDRIFEHSDSVFTAAVMPALFIYFEIVLRISTGIGFTLSALLYVLLFSFIAGGALYFASTFGTQRTNRIVFLSVCGVFGLIYAVYEVYYSFFRAFIDMNALGEAGNMFKDFLGNIVGCTLKNLHWIALFFLPLALFFYLTKRVIRIDPTPIKFKGVAALIAIVFFILRGLIISANDTDYGDKFYYGEGYDVTIAAGRFGLPTSIGLNIRYTLFGKAEAELTPPETLESVDMGQLFGTTSPQETTTKDPDVIPFVPVEQKLDINFSELAANAKDSNIKAMHQYFGALTPTMTNEYTGMFKGKNLIYITAEAFTDKMISAEFTPTLYKMATEGFVFNNCYNGLWGGSTATGEYLSMTGIFYNSSNCLKKSGGGVDDKGARLMYYALGNSFKRADYTTYAFHNHNPQYYSRHLSHPNFGFTFIGANGTYGDYTYTGGITYPTDAWPKSDLEMAKLSTPYYIDSDNPFCAYYMSVSGHANYNWAGNNMSKKHRDEVADLPYSDEVKAYIACSYELELMLSDLIAQLTAKGKLEDTVFVISADHYPYALSTSSLAELYDLPEDGILDNFDLFRNKFIIWSASMDEPVIVNKYCSSADIIPTVYNLFGIEYDSRLLIGSDVLSTSDGIVILNTHNTYWNWITDYGYYSTDTKKFTPHPGVTIGSESELNTYIKNMNSIVSNKRKYSLAILDNDYYRYVFG